MSRKSQHERHSPDRGVLGGDVRIGSGNTIGAFVVITGPVVIGDDNWVGTGVVIGAPPLRSAATRIRPRSRRPPGMESRSATET